MVDEVPKWNPLFADSMASLGVAPRVCKPFKPQTKGKVERTVGVIKYGFWPGVRFTDIDDLNAQASRWCDRLNQKVHRTTRKIPLELWVEEGLSALPKDYAWERFGTEERRVSLDGFISYDGVQNALTCASTCGGVNGSSAGTSRRVEDLSPRQPHCDGAEAPAFSGDRHSSRAVSRRGSSPVSAAERKTTGAPGAGSPGRHPISCRV